MIDALIKRVSVTYKCYEMYAHRGKKVQLLVFWAPTVNNLKNYTRPLINPIIQWWITLENYNVQWITLME
jgi:hypothetical protein